MNEDTGEALAGAGSGLGSMSSMFGPIGMGLSAVSGIVGLIQSGQAQHRNAQIAHQQKNFLDQQYLPDMNKRYLDTDQAQSFLSTMRERMTTANKQVEQTNAVTGGTDEAALAGRENNAQVYSNALNGLAAQGTAYQQNLKDRYSSGMNQVYGEQMGMNAQQSQSGSNVFSNSMASMGKLAMLPMLGGASSN